MVLRGLILMTRCDAYWDKVRKILATDDKEALFDFCNKNPRTVSDIVDHVQYIDRLVEKSANGSMLLPFQKSTLSARATEPLRKLERENPILHDTVLSEVCQLENPTAKEVKRIIQEKKIESYPKQESDERIILDSIENIENYLKPNSVDLILTDPPYPEEFLPLWDILFEKSLICLKEGGILVSYSPHIYLPQIFSKVPDGLNYVWIIAQIHTGPPATYHPSRVNIRWKPILIFVKGKLPDIDYYDDILNGSGREKLDHEWQQSLGESEELIKRFSQPNQFIVDPFLGSGTTVLAAKNTGRNFFGMDIDELAIKTTLGRLSS